MNGKILVLGVGRIGAEALENVVACGFDDIQIIDMESEDVEDLRQQFFETVCSYGKPRDEVIRDNTLALHPNIKIKTTNYGYSFFQQFDLVLNALDNPLDRDQVNVMCHKANVSFIDCYECALQEPTTIEIIQNTPTDLMHCVTWTLHLFHYLFDREVVDRVHPVQKGSKVFTALKVLNVLNELNCKEKSDDDIHHFVKNSNYNVRAIFEKKLEDDILFLLNNSEPIDTRLNGIDREYKVWSEYDCRSIFEASSIELQKVLTEQDQMNSSHVERAFLDFVTATANLHATAFGLSRKSRLEIRFILTLILNEPGLLDMPNEVLDCVFGHFDDNTLLAASRTCKRFKSVVDRTFERKYSSQPYKVTIVDDIESKKIYRAILLNFGTKFTDIEIADAELTDEHRWLLDVLKENVGLKKLKLSSDYDEADINLGEILLAFPNLTHLNLDGYIIDEDNWSNIHMPYLKHLGFYDMELDLDVFGLGAEQFFENNRQIESLVFDDSTSSFLAAINNRMNMLKRLEISTVWLEPIPQINLDSLEQLILSEYAGTHIALDSFVNGCKNIKELSVDFMDDAQLDEKYVSIIASFEKLESLEIDDDEIKIDTIKLVERQLPNLKSFSVITEIDSEDVVEDQLTVDEILSLVSNSKLLTKLKVAIDVENLDRFDAEFHARFIVAIGAHRPDFELLLELELRNQTINLVVTKNQIIHTNMDLNTSIVLHRAGSTENSVN